jgi:hypothetical protein
MLVKDLKQRMFLPNKEVLINKIVNIRGRDVHLISITAQEQRNVLWVMYQVPLSLDVEVYPKMEAECTSNREQMLNNLKSSSDDYRLSISEMVIQNKKITFSSSRSSHIDRVQSEEYAKLQHFIEEGITTTNWDEVNLRDIVIAGLVQKEEEQFPEIDLSKDLEISLNLIREFNQVLVGDPMTLEFGEVEKGKKFYFYDSIQKINRTFYIDKMYHYDIWSEVNEFFSKEYIPGTPEARLKEMKDEYLIGVESTCPKGMNLAMLEYETEDGIQLDFYSTEYLEQKPILSSSSSGMLFKSDEKFGSNGFRSRICMIKPVPQDFKGSIEVELFSWFMEIPEENIIVT